MVSKKSKFWIVVMLVIQFLAFSVFHWGNTMTAQAMLEAGLKALGN